MNFEIYGPYKLPKKCQNGLLDKKQAKSSLINSGDNPPTELSGCGCYIFAVKAAKGIKPWYVGKAVKQSFEKECLKTHQLNIYNDVIAGRKGNPLLLLIALKTPKGKFAKPGSAHQKKIDFLETILIGAALKRNRSLMNVQKTAFLKKMVVPGFINSPQRQPTHAEKSFENILLRPRRA
jgi:hypothetical protein